MAAALSPEATFAARPPSCASASSAAQGPAAERRAARQRARGLGRHARRSRPPAAARCARRPREARLGEALHADSAHVRVGVLQAVEQRDGGLRALRLPEQVGRPRSARPRAAPARAGPRAGASASGVMAAPLRAATARLSAARALSALAGSAEATRARCAIAPLRPQLAQRLQQREAHPRLGLARLGAREPLRELHLHGLLERLPGERELACGEGGLVAHARVRIREPREHRVQRGGVLDAGQRAEGAHAQPGLLRAERELRQLAERAPVLPLEHARAARTGARLAAAAGGVAGGGALCGAAGARAHPPEASDARNTTTHEEVRVSRVALMGIA